MDSVEGITELLRPTLPRHLLSVVGAKATKYYELAIKGPTRDKDKIMDREKALKKVRKGGVALYGCNTEMFQIIQSTFTGPEICSIYIMDMLFMPVSVAIRKKSPYREIYYKAQFLYSFNVEYVTPLTALVGVVRTGTPDTEILIALTIMKKMTRRTPYVCSSVITIGGRTPPAIGGQRLRAKTPYLDFHRLSRFLESGLKDYEDKKWHAHRPPCYGTEDTAPVELEATLIAQMIFVGGFVLAIICFQIEKAIKGL